MEVLLRAFGHIGPKDVLDIIIVAILIYQLLMIVQGTRAVQMLVGVLVLAAIYGIGNFYGLHALNWLLDHFFDSFFVILIILFQDQIRSGLASVGPRKKLFGGLSRHEFDIEVDEVSEVCKALSSERIGALIAFERSHGLANYIATGTFLNSQVSSDLLYSIFESRGSLHDGAIIISKGIVKAAGCFLPLSRSVEIDKHMGTRHRAAVGLTEMSDAAVVVVSEETGKMSLCVEGKFYTCENEMELRQKLKMVLLGLPAQGMISKLETKEEKQ